MENKKVLMLFVKGGKKRLSIFQYVVRLHKIALYVFVYTLLQQNPEVFCLLHSWLVLSFSLQFRRSLSFSAISNFFNWVTSKYCQLALNLCVRIYLTQNMLTSWPFFTRSYLGTINALQEYRDATEAICPDRRPYVWKGNLKVRDYVSF